MSLSAHSILAGSTLAILLVPLSGGLNAQTNTLAELLPSDTAAGSGFGYHVVMDGDLVAIASSETSDPFTGGVIDVFRDDGPNGLIFEARIESPSVSSQIVNPFPDQSGFGIGLALDGDTLVVSNNYAAWTEQSPDVNVYRRDNSGSWALEQTLTYVLPNTFPVFGSSVDIEGDRIVVAATFASFNSTPGAGALYVYERSGTAWTFTDTLTLDTTASGGFSGRMGQVVKMVGGRIVTTSRGSGPSGFVSAVIVFSLGTGAQWTQETVLIPFPTDRNEIDTVAFDGQSIAIDFAPVAQAMNGNTERRVAVYRLSGATWSRISDAFPADFPTSFPVPAPEYGAPHGMNSQLAVRGSRIYRGDPYADVSGEPTGAVEVFEYDGVSWNSQGVLQDPSGNAWDFMGASIAQDEGRLLVGVPGREDSGVGDVGLNTGSARLFRVEDPPLSSFCSSAPFACTSCPCGNDAAAGSGTGCTNSSGVGAKLVGSGEPLPLDDSLRFDLEGATPSSFAFLAVGTIPLPNLGSNCPPGSGVVGSLLDGKRCIGGGLRRLGLRAVDAQGSVGATNTPWGGGNAPAGGIVAASGGSFGATLYYQAFYRDNGVGSCGTGVNTSNGVRALLLP